MGPDPIFLTCLFDLVFDLCWTCFDLFSNVDLFDVYLIAWLLIFFRVVFHF